LIRDYEIDLEAHRQALIWQQWCRRIRLLDHADRFEHLMARPAPILLDRSGATFESGTKNGARSRP